jgi:hypothetical protein
MRRRQRVVVRTSIVRAPFRCATIHAGARERAGARRGVDAAAAAAPSLKDRVRARNDRADRDLPRILFHSARKPMTAYLLSLALIGLVAIVISEGLS